MIIKAILVMGGSGQRFGSPLPKQFHTLLGKKVYIYALETLLKSQLFAEIILVVPQDWISQVQTEIPSGPIKIIKGGETRQNSSHLGLLACGEKTDYVLIHDAVRPLVSHRILKDNVEAVQTFKAVNTCIPSTDTLIQRSADNFIVAIPNRSDYMRAQTPQSFSYPLIMKAHATTTTLNATDDCQLLLQAKIPIKLVMGEESNLKITTETDFFFIEKLLTQKVPHP